MRILSAEPAQAFLLVTNGSGWGMYCCEGAPRIAAADHASTAVAAGVAAGIEIKLAD